MCSIMRNFSVSKRLVRNQKVLIRSISERIVTVSVIADDGFALQERHPLPRIAFEFQLPFTGYKIVRHQFPLKLAYAVTFHSCVGLTLDHVGLACDTPVFAHGQLYTALTRVANRHRCTLLVGEEQEDLTNVVYPALTV